MMLSDFLDSEVSELRTETAEGLAKLMYSGRISSAKLLSRLVLLWYNPVTEDDTRLRHCLGVFFQLYARESRYDTPLATLPGYTLTPSYTAWIHSDPWLHCVDTL
uniref:Nuclear condensin complex subunit 3 C-terminal domain-containing protein n=1 Tax=Hucho hucho TaxID=62062 RepID=A0A4W5LNU1_9TELE